MKMVKFFSESENPRMKQQQELKLDQTWREKSPNITVKPYKNKGENLGHCTEHMISNEINLFVAQRDYISVIDVETLDILHRLDVCHENAEGYRSVIRMEADENFLVAFVRLLSW